MPNDFPPRTAVAAEPIDRPRSVTFRAAVVGLIGTCLIAALAPWNDLLVENTFLIGGAMPVGPLVLVLALLTLINWPLRVYVPRAALRTGELAVVWSIMLVGCAVPAVGFMNYVVGGIAGTPRLAGMNPGFAALLDSLNLPSWVFPALSGNNAMERGNDSLLNYFLDRLPRDGSVALPWSRWIAPAIAWGLWAAAMYGAVLFLSVLLRRQWVETERLPFPIASMYLSLIEQEPSERDGRLLLGRRRFWIAVAVVFAIRGMSALSTYFPQVPAIPLGWDFRSLLADPPWKYSDELARVSGVYFAVIGLTFFLQARVAFSIWACFLAIQVVKMISASFGEEFTGPAMTDQMMGSGLVWVGLMLWVGRHHWSMILRHMVGLRRAGDVNDPVLPYVVAGWGLVGCCAGMVTWLWLAGASIAGAVLLVGMLLLVFLIIARIAAETGLYYAQFNVPLNRPWTLLFGLFSSPLRTTNGTFFWTSFMGAAFAHDTRECASIYTTHALKLHHETSAGSADRRSWLRGASFVLLLAVSLALSYSVSGASMIYMEYQHGIALNERAAQVNSYGTDYVPRNLILSPTQQYASTAGPAKVSHSPTLHVVTGGAITAVLGFLRLRFNAWPIYPIGFLLALSFPVARMWFSIFLGWLAKSLTVKLGGAKLLTEAKPVFIGFIVGEAGAVVFWLIVNLSLAASGMPYKVIYFTP